MLNDASKSYNMAMNFFIENANRNVNDIISLIETDILEKSNKGIMFTEKRYNFSSKYKKYKTTKKSVVNYKYDEPEWEIVIKTHDDYITIDEVIKIIEYFKEKGYLITYKIKYRNFLTWLLNKPCSNVLFKIDWCKK